MKLFEIFSKPVNEVVDSAFSNPHFQTGKDYVQIDKDRYGVMCSQCDGTGFEGGSAGQQYRMAGVAKAGEKHNPSKRCTTCRNSSVPGYTDIRYGKLDYNPDDYKGNLDKFIDDSPAILDFITQHQKSPLGNKALAELEATGTLNAELYRKIEDFLSKAKEKEFADTDPGLKKAKTMKDDKRWKMSSEPKRR